MSRGTQALINFANLRHNFEVLNQLAANKLVLVVKADAYGHGLKETVQALDKARCFAVATIEEALTIRKIRPKIRVLLLEGFLNKRELQIAFDNKFDSVVHQPLQIQLLDEVEHTKKINIWLKYDSGMNRLGLNATEFTAAITKFEDHQQVNELILMSHFASANQVHNSFTQKQTDDFLTLANKHQLSLSNSSALLRNKQLPDEWCRVGISLFGVSPIERTSARDYNLKPVMTLKTNIIAIKKVEAGQSIGYGQIYQAPKERIIAIIGIGYGDGYPWVLKKTAYVKLHGKKARIVGRVSMDMIAIDISSINAKVGDNILIWGQDHNADLPVEKVAEKAKTIPYVLLCQITSRVHYNYV